MKLSRTFLATIFTIVLLTALCAMLGCATRADEQVSKILADISDLQTKEEALVTEAAVRENIFSADRIEHFPENRDELKSVAQRQIESLNRIIDLEDRQIAMLDGIRTVTADKDFLLYMELNKQIWEKRRDDKQLAIRKFMLISDPNINSKPALERGIEEIKSRQDQIDEEIRQRELQKTEVRKRIGT